MAEIPEAEGDAAEVFEAAVDRFDRTVGEPDVEVGQDLTAPLPEAAAELRQLLESLRDTGTDSFEALEHRQLPSAAIRVPVSVDQLLIAPGRDLDRGMSIVGRQRGVELRLLLVGEQFAAGEQDPSNTEQWIP